jgi:hypothetical protein
MNRITAPALAIAALLALPAAGQASQTFGSQLKNSPAPGPACVETTPGPCTIVSYINPNADGDPVTSPAPADGVIVKLRIKSAGPETVTFRLATVNKQGDVVFAQAAGTGPSLNLQGTGDIEEFAARVPVAQGAHIALDSPSTKMVYNQGGDEFAYLYAPTLAEGQGPRAPSAEGVGELLVQAVMEPDADRDGFGDETQDGCSSQASVQGACDNSAPAVQSLRLKGRSIRYSLSEAASVRLRIEKNRNGRFATIRTLTSTGSAGKNIVSLRRALPAGRYRVVAVATDSSGNKSASKRFAIRRR